MRAAALVLGLLAASGCCFDAKGELPFADGGGAGASGIAGAAGSDGGVVVATIGSDAGLPPIACTTYVPPAMTAACPSPAVAAGGAIAFPTSQPVSSWALATSGGGEASLAFILGDTASPQPWRVYLQRLSGEGELRGPLNEIDLPEWGALVALAASPVSHVICWEDSGLSIACAAMPVGGGPVYPGIEVAGQLPGVAYGPAGFLLAYRGSDGSVAIQPLDCSARAAGPATKIAGFGAQALGFVASADGYALVVDPPAPASAAMAVQFVTAKGTPDGPPMQLQGAFVSGSSLALSANVLAVDSDLATTAGPNGQYSCGTGPVAAASGSFGTICASQGGFGQGPAVAWMAVDTTGRPLGPTAELDAKGVGMAVLSGPVADGFLLMTQGGAIFHLGCP